MASASILDVTDKELDEAWSQYKNDRSIENRNRLLFYYVPSLQVIAKQFMRGGCVVSFDDLVQEGMIALIGLIDRFDSNLNVKFWTYSACRVYGTMRDVVRWWSHTHRKGTVRGVELKLRNLSHLQSTEYEDVYDFEDQDYLEWAMQGLLPREKQILTMRMQGKTWPEIGTAVNLSKMGAAHVMWKQIQPYILDRLEHAR